jgi:multimeric flavodoxin WrbA
MTKVLGIMGSPRRNGNTHILVSKILEGAAGQGAETELIFLDKLKIRECDGCHACWQGKECSKKDDMNNLYGKIAGSDILVFGTPVYWYGPTALMKALIDRFVYFGCPENRIKIKGKAAALAIPYEEENNETGEFVAAFFEKSFNYLELRLAAKILVPGVAEKGDILKKEVVLARALELGRRLTRENNDFNRLKK